MTDGDFMEIDLTAPALAEADIVIDAPIEVVWNAVVDVANWPRWNANVSDVSVDGALALGTTFAWKAGKARITSKIAAFEPHTHLAWTGKTLMVRAVHVWRFTAMERGTRVSSAESFSGIAPMLFSGPMTKLLERSIRTELSHLKIACER
jgi:hypothetical protein